MAAARTRSAGALRPSRSGRRRSSHWISISPRWNSGSSMTRRWNSRDVSTPTMVSSRSARCMRATACSRVAPQTISLASIGS